MFDCTRERGNSDKQIAADLSSLGLPSVFAVLDMADGATFTDIMHVNLDRVQVLNCGFQQETGMAVQLWGAGELTVVNSTFEAPQGMNGLSVCLCYTPLGAALLNPSSSVLSPCG